LVNFDVVNAALKGVSLVAVLMREKLCSQYNRESFDRILYFGDGFVAWNVWMCYCEYRVHMGKQQPMHMFKFSNAS
jgi:hypothetical protein